jgi:hypothetical protein
MMYPYMKLEDKTEAVHSQIIEREDGDHVEEVHFERPTHQGFDSARCVLPEHKWKFREGYSDEEIAFLRSCYTTTPTCFSSLPGAGGSSVPSIFHVGGYVVFSWPNENGEPIH